MSQTQAPVMPDALLRERFGQDLQAYLPLATVTSMAIGGPARWFLQARSEADLVDAIRIARSCGIDWCVMGDGSNLVGSDAGYDGLLIQNRIHAFVAIDGSLAVGAGDHLSEVVLQADRLGLAGLEKMAGIPGTIGGAIYGCAGAYGQEMRDHVCEVRYYDAHVDRFEALSADECLFGYRDSIFKRHKDWVITQVVLDLTLGDPETLLKASQDLIQSRQRKFSLDLKCPGCYFKNIRLDYIETAAKRRGVPLADRPDPGDPRQGGGGLPAGGRRREGDAGGQRPGQPPPRQPGREHRWNRLGGRPARPGRADSRPASASDSGSNCRKRCSTWGSEGLERGSVCVNHGGTETRREADNLDIHLSTT